MVGKKISEDRALDILQSMKGRWTCAECGHVHEGLRDLVAFAPDHWASEKSYEPNSSLRLDGDFLSEDFCVLGGRYFFIRGVSIFQVAGLGQSFGFGTWSTLSKENFYRYLDGFDTGVLCFDAPCFGWFANRIEPFDDTRNKPCEVHMRQGRQRPQFVLSEMDTDFARAQRDGLSAARLLQVLKRHGHRPDYS